MDAEAAVEAVTRLGLDPVAEAEAVGVDEPIRRGGLAVAEEVPAGPARSTIPFPPVILPIDDGPPTYVYEGSEPSDRVG